MLTKIEIKKLRKELPNKYADSIAVQFNVSASYVYAIAAGRRINAEILEALIQLAKENKEKLLNTKQILNSL